MNRHDSTIGFREPTPPGKASYRMRGKGVAKQAEGAEHHTQGADGFSAGALRDRDGKSGPWGFVFREFKLERKLSESKLKIGSWVAISTSLIDDFPLLSIWFTTAVDLSSLVVELAKKDLNVAFCFLSLSFSSCS